MLHCHRAAGALVLAQGCVKASPWRRGFYGHGQHTNDTMTSLPTLCEQQQSGHVQARRTCTADCAASPQGPPPRLSRWLSGTADVKADVAARWAATGDSSFCRLETTTPPLASVASASRRVPTTPALSSAERLLPCSLPWTVGTARAGPTFSCAFRTRFLRSTHGLSPCTTGGKVKQSSEQAHTCKGHKATEVYAAHDQRRQVQARRAAPVLPCLLRRWDIQQADCAACQALLQCRLAMRYGGGAGVGFTIIG